MLSYVQVQMLGVTFPVRGLLVRLVDRLFGRRIDWLIGTIHRVGRLIAWLIDILIDTVIGIRVGIILSLSSMCFPKGGRAGGGPPSQKATNSRFTVVAIPKRGNKNTRGHIHLSSYSWFLEPILQLQGTGQTVSAHLIG